MRLATLTGLLLVPTVFAAAATLSPNAPSATKEPAAAVFRHPHFPKKVEMSLGFSQDAPKISVSHLTVTFNRDGFKKMPDGGAWHLANGKLRTEADVKIGGHDVEYGNYRLLARKAGDKWELVLDPIGRDFSTDISEEALTLKTDFRKSKARQEHLRIDLQPSGVEDAMVLQLEVHFDDYVAIAKIEIPDEEE